MADDICFDMIHARELIRNECCDVISLYPGKNGGIRKARAIAEFAAEHGVACSIGSNLEYDVATAAMCHLIVATENMRVEDYPGDDSMENATRINQVFEDHVRAAPEQYLWTHRRFKNQPGIYD